MILLLYEKILNIFTLSQLREKIGNVMTSRIKNHSPNVSIEKICSLADFKKLDYSFEDFISDYGEKYSEHKEKRMIYNIFKNGKSPSGLIKEFNLESTVYYYFKNGFIYSGKARDVHLIFDILEITVDISDFQLTIFETHIELFGEKELLLKFQERYSLPYEVIFEPYLESWHIAFDGCLAEHIKYKNKTGNS